MSEFAIKVDGISKAYRIGVKEQRHDTLGASISAWVKSPFKNFKKLRSLSDFSNQEDSDIFWALKDITFNVKQGEVLGIIGKNGAGKSTLLKILSRITEPTSGRIEIYGRVASLLEVGTGFNPELTGRENVYLNGTILGMTKKEINSKFDEIVAFSGIEKFIDTPVKRYSSGMKVRLAFSVAAHLDPEILIIDEVLAVGDAEFQNKCLGKMNDIAENNGRTVLFVSHNMSAVQTLCTRSIVLENGAIVFSGSTTHAISKYLLGIKENNANPNTFFSFNVTGINQKDNFTINHDEGFSLNFLLHSKADIPQISLYYVILDEDGKILIHYRDDNFPIKVGSSEYVISVPRLDLRPGNYASHFKIVNQTNVGVSRFESDRFNINVIGNVSLHASAGLLIKDLSIVSA